MRIPALLVSSLLMVACGGGAIAKAPPPLRPKPVEADLIKPPTPTGPTDCDPITAANSAPAKTYGERSIPEAEKLANAGLADLQSAEVGGVDPRERERLITAAVDTFIQSLLADPYNVQATYNLAAAYARIDRPQCSINLLERLLQMRSHASKKDAVEKKLDRLLGRKGQSLDPDFNDMRGDQRFRELIAKMCAGTDDPSCVLGK